MVCGRSAVPCGDQEQSAVQVIDCALLYFVSDKFRRALPVAEERRERLAPVRRSGGDGLQYDEHH
jgi:hypothetical protein